MLQTITIMTHYRYYKLMIELITTVERVLRIFASGEK